MLKLRYEVVFRTYLSLVSAFLFYVGLDAMRQHDRWAMGDWLINYAGGFVRRGVMGQAALDLSHLPLHFSPYFYVLLLQLLCYAIIFGTVLYLVHGRAWTFWMILMVYSPATLSFTVFDPTFAFRKEILFLAILGAAIVALKTRMVSDAWLSFLLMIAMTLLVLSHEGMIFYYPYVMCAIIVTHKDLRRALLISAPGALAGIGSFIAASRHPGTLSTVYAICSSLGEQDLTAEPCSGAIIYMTKTPAAAHNDVLGAISYWHLKFVMPFLLMMSLLPLIVGLKALWKQKKLHHEWWALVSCSTIAWAASTGLFVYGFDWNRWIYVHALSALMIMLLINADGQVTAEKQEAFFRENGRYKLPTIAATALLLVGWQLSFYHHFPVPGDKLAVYMLNRLHHRPVHKKLEWTPSHTS